MGALDAMHGGVPAAHLVKVTPNSVSEVDKKGVDAGAGHVSYDNSLMFSKWQVDSELFPMGNEGQPAADAHRSVGQQTRAEVEKTWLTMSCKGPPESHREVERSSD